MNTIILSTLALIGASVISSKTIEEIYNDEKVSMEIPQTQSGAYDIKVVEAERADEATVAIDAKAGGEIDTRITALENKQEPTQMTTNDVTSIVSNTVSKGYIDSLGVAEDKIPYTRDRYGNLTALTIGSRVERSAVGQYSVAFGDDISTEGNSSFAQGRRVSASGIWSCALGFSSQSSGIASFSVGVSSRASGDVSYAHGADVDAEGMYSMAIGNASRAKDDYSFVWGGDTSHVIDDFSLSNLVNITRSSGQYTSHGAGTFNIMPYGGLYGFWIGENNLGGLLDAKLDASAYTEILEGISVVENRASTNTTKITKLEETVGAVAAYLNAEDAHFVATNYDSVVHIPSAYVEIKMRDDDAKDGYSWITIWREMTRWDAFLGDGFDLTTWRDLGGFTAYTNAVDESIADARAWGHCDSDTGALSPDGAIQISQDIAFMSGMGYSNVVSSGSAIWVLKNTSGVHPAFDEAGRFTITDDAGETFFEIIKGTSKELGADATGITVDGGTRPVVTVTYEIAAYDHPTLQISETLRPAAWHSESDADCPATVSWSGSSGAWVASVQRKTDGNALFIKATYSVQTETIIKQNAPVQMEYIYLGGVKYALGTAEISGKTVLTLNPAN